MPLNTDEDFGWRTDPGGVSGSATITRPDPPPGDEYLSFSNGAVMPGYEDLLEDPSEIGGSGNVGQNPGPVPLNNPPWQPTSNPAGGQCGGGVCGLPPNDTWSTDGQAGSCTGASKKPPNCYQLCDEKCKTAIKNAKDILTENGCPVSIVLTTKSCHNNPCKKKKRKAKCSSTKPKRKRKCNPKCCKGKPCGKACIYKKHTCHKR
jgi:hypothetical protein